MIDQKDEGRFLGSVRLSKCEVCQKNEFKYKCPRCFIKTCSLVCCRQHKVENNCNGERDKTKYVDKEEFDERLLLNDYRFLEEQSRLVDNFQRTLEQQTRKTPEGLKPFHSGVYEQLRKFVYRNFGIRLQLMPPQSTRHVFNRTRFNRHIGLVSWSIEFAFYLPEPDCAGKLSKFFRFSTKGVIFSSKTILKQVLSDFYKKFKSELFNSSNRALDQRFTHVLEKENFESELSVLYEVVDMKERKKYHQKLDFGKNLEENLSNKTIIEYPTIFIVRNEDLDKFDIKEEVNQEVESEKEESETPSTDDEPDESEGKLIHEDLKRGHKGGEREEIKKIKLDKTPEPCQNDDELEEGEI